MPHPGGRPLKFKSVEELQTKIDAYFADCDPHMEEVTEWVEARDATGKLKKDKHGLNYLVEVTHKIMTKPLPYTITGLALALETTRDVLIDYENGKYDEKAADYSDEHQTWNDQVDRFSNTIKMAKQKCQKYVESVLFTGNAAGPIFNLKNNYGWKDKTETDLTSAGNELKGASIFFADKPSSETP